MNESSIWAIFVLLVTALVAVFALLTEKREIEINPSFFRRWRKRGFYLLAVAAFVIGATQIWKADKESRKAERNHDKEHQQDQQQISNLQESVKTLGEVNDKQYQRNQEQLEKVRQEVTSLKQAKMTEEDRKKIAALEDELNKAMAPKPKAALDFGFFYPYLLKGEKPRKDMFLTSNGNPIQIPFMALNTSSEVNAKDLEIWIRICPECKFHSEPRGAIKPDNSPESDRLYRWRDLPPLVANAEITIDMEVPRNITKAAISFDYRCDDCTIETDWQTLWVDIGQLPMPKFSASSPTSKKPIKKH